MERLRGEPSDGHDLRMDWTFDGVEFDEEEKIRDETRKILERPELPIGATCVRVPVLVGHAEAVWIETEEPLAPEDAERILGDAPGVVLDQFPTPAKARRRRGRSSAAIRRDPADREALALFLACDNLRKGAALNAIQIVELVLGARGRGVGR